MDRRSELVRDCRRYLLSHGVATLSLRPLADEVGTSARLLVYHFGSKEALIQAVMDDVRRDLQAAFAEAMQAGSGTHPVLAFWRAITTRRRLPVLRLLFEVQVLAIQSPRRYARYLSDTSSGWLALIEGSLPEAPGRRALATLYTSVVDGLLLELLATRDLGRTTAALEAFLDLAGGRAKSSALGTRSLRRRAARKGTR